MILKRVKIELTITMREPDVSISEYVRKKYGDKAKVIKSSTLRMIREKDGSRYIQEAVDVL